MKLTRRETVLSVVASAAVLYGITAIAARPYLDQWKALRAQQDEVRWRIEQDRGLIAQADRVTGMLQELSEMVPVYPPDQRMDAHWLSVMDRLASEHGVNISRRQAGEEQQVGDAYELPIECREWEASLDALVRFLFELQSEGAMLDIRQLLIKPRGQGILRGRFTLYCAYARAGDAGAGEVEP